MKQCCKCKTYKSTDEYYKNSRTRDGLNTYCIACHKADNIARKRQNRCNPKFREAELKYKKQYRTINQPAIKHYMQEWRAKNPTRTAEYYQENIERIKQYAAQYRKNNKAKINAKTRKRQTAQMNRTPKWLNTDDYWVIQEIYDLAALRTEQTGIAWHVDHVIPLQGKLVSGLHVPNNLQVIPAVANYKKHNLYEVDYGVN